MKRHESSFNCFFPSRVFTFIRVQALFSAQFPQHRSVDRSRFLLQLEGLSIFGSEQKLADFGGVGISIVFTWDWGL